MDKIIATIKAVGVKKLGEGSIGFLTEEEPDKWYNIYDSPERLNEILESEIIKGNVIEFSVDEKDKRRVLIETIAVKEKATTDNKNWAEDMTNFEDLLADAHKKFGEKLSITTALMADSLNWEKQKAVFKAVVSIGSGETTQIFEAHGDAEGILNKIIQPHFMRMAETRAIARALRWATNNAKTAKEESE